MASGQPRLTIVVDAPPLTARSVVLSLLLGARPAQLPVRDLLDAGETFGIAPATMRVALSRMVSSGDLTTRDAVYALSQRHLERQRLQEDALAPRLLPWDGAWEMLVVTATGRDAAVRSLLRARLRDARLAKLREGVWIRPANLDRIRPVVEDGHAQWFSTRPEDPEALVAELWDLQGWAAQGENLLRAVRVEGQSADRLTAAASLVRHLRSDPALPREMLPADWPADAMRSAYEDYRSEVMAMSPTRHTTKESR